MTTASKKSRVQVKCPKCEHIFLPSLKEVQSRAGKAARRKGANFENKLAKRFKAWWPGDHDFRRTPQSGGSALKEGWDLAGDIATTAKDFSWHLELKNAPGSFAGLHQFYTSSKGSLWKWLAQAKSDCRQGKIPLLIFNRFDMPTYCALKFKWDSYITERLDRSNISYYEFYDANKEDRIIIWHLDDMLNSDPENWK